MPGVINKEGSCGQAAKIDGRWVGGGTFLHQHRHRDHCHDRHHHNYHGHHGGQFLGQVLVC